MLASIDGVQKPLVTLTDGLRSIRSILDMNQGSQFSHHTNKEMHRQR
jgi:hypothetical protein